jgi:glycosyltransferase involved in cell wall biosynthesis
MVYSYKCVVSCPIDTYSGYGARSRDFVKALLKTYPQWDIKVLPQRWGNTREGFLEDHGLTFLQELLLPQLTYRPEIWIQITVPNEFQAVGTFNIGVTAGIETDRVAQSWLEGCNRMTTVLTSSYHSKSVFENTEYNVNGRVVKLTTPVEVLFEGYDETVYRILKPEENSLDLDTIRENFVFLVVGHWLQGDVGHDRKNIGFTIKTFLETFKNKPNPPALLLKVQSANASISDRDHIVSKVDAIKKTVRGKLPNIYLLHGEMSDEEINQLYNHSKIKALISLTKGEGFGRPLLEFSVIDKPIIASNWSGHLDFLNGNYTRLITGTLETVHASVQSSDTLIQGSRWFSVDSAAVGQAYLDIYKNYKKFLKLAERRGDMNRQVFTLDKMSEKLQALLTATTPPIPVHVPIEIPELEKIK